VAIRIVVSERDVWHRLATAVGNDRAAVAFVAAVQIAPQSHREPLGVSARPADAVLDHTGRS
jgi:hypothetical protein